MFDGVYVAIMSFCTLPADSIDSNKVMFPYKLLTSYDRLDNRELPEYAEFYSYLWYMNMLIESFESWMLQNSRKLMQLSGSLPKRREGTVDTDLRESAPKDGLEVYADLQHIDWKGMDLLSRLYTVLQHTGCHTIYISN